MLSLLHPLGVVFNLVGPEDQLVRAAVKLVRNHLLEMLEDRMETQDQAALARPQMLIQKQIQFTDFKTSKNLHIFSCFTFLVRACFSAGFCKFAFLFLCKGASLYMKIIITE